MRFSRKISGATTLSIKDLTGRASRFLHSDYAAPDGAGEICWFGLL